MATIQMVFSAHVIDNNGRSRACTAYYQRPDTTTLAQLIDALEGFGAGIQNISDGLVDRLSASIADTAWIPTAVNNGHAPIEQTGLLNFLATGTGKRWGMAVPAISNDRLTGDRINLLDEDIDLVIAQFVAGNYTNDHGQVLTSLADALVSFRKDRKQLQRSSIEAA